MFSTSVLLKQFVTDKQVDPILLSPLRLVVAEADQLGTKTAFAFQERFEKAVFEGYGTTETAPVASVNLPDQLDPSR